MEQPVLGHFFINSTNPYWMLANAQLVKAPAVKPDGLSLIPETHTMEGENGILQDVIWPFTSTTASACSYKINKCILKSVN